MFLLCCFDKKNKNKSKELSIFDKTNHINKNLIINKLKNIEYNDTKIFYHNFTYCKCIKVYDGDTITVATNIDHNTLLPYTCRFQIRLMGIDAPEIKGINENEKKQAIISRDKLKEKILGKIITLKIIEKPEKFGRILAYVYFNDENINQWMLNNNLAIEYYGKTKIKPDL